VGKFNRNIIIAADIERLRAARHPDEIPKTLDVAPPAGVVGAVAPSPSPPGEPSVVAAASGGVNVPTEDDYLTKLLKYVPPEVIGAYLFLAGTVTTNVTDRNTLRWWLGVLLVAMLVVTAVYDWRVLNIIRSGQILMSVIGLATYVFAVGGWFATMGWYKSWYGTFALAFFGLLIAVVRLKPLPAPADQR
jgi:hypothetical protein